MDSRSLLRKERHALCDTLTELGPDASTLCEGWTTADLAAHLMVREREPLAAAGIVLPGPFADLNRRRMEAAKKGGYQRSIEWLRGGPYGIWRLGQLQALNVGEYFVHHEDARRANGMEPRPADPDLDGALAQGPDGRGAVLRKGFPEAKITGAPGEIVLYLMGRKQAARVELSGSEMAVAALSSAPLRV